MLGNALDGQILQLRNLCPLRHHKPDQRDNISVAVIFLSAFIIIIGV